MAIFHEIFGSNPRPLGDDCLSDYDQTPRPAIAFTRQRSAAWLASEQHRKAGDLDRAISAALLTLCYDAMGGLTFDLDRQAYVISPQVPAYGIFRSLRTRLKASGQTLNDVRSQFDDEVSALTAYLPGQYTWRSPGEVWTFVAQGMEDVS